MVKDDKRRRRARHRARGRPRRADVADARARRRPRRLAAPAGRDRRDRRAALAAASSPPRSKTRACRRPGWTRARVLMTDSSTPAAPLMDETRARCRELLVPLVAAGRIPILGGFIGSTTAGVTTTLGRGGSDYSASIFGVGVRASEIQIWTDVDGMLTRRSARDRQPASGAETVIQRSVRAGLLRREGAASEHHHARRGRGDSRAHPELAASRGAGHAHHRGWRGRSAAADRHRLQARRHGDRHRVDAHADGARLPAAAVRSVRAASHRGRRGDDLRGQRLGHHRRSPPASTPSSRTSPRSPMCRSPTKWRWSARSAKACASTRRSRRAVVGALDGIPLRMVSQAGSRRNITFVMPAAHLTDAMTRLHTRFCDQPVGAHAEGR